MSKKKTKKNINNFLKDIEEWQNHQYDPGYFLGGKIPPYIKNPGNRKLLILSLLIPIVMILTVATIMFFKQGHISLLGFEENYLVGRIFTGFLIILLITIAVFLLIKIVFSSKE